MTKNIVLHYRTFGELSKNNNITENGIYVYLCLEPFTHNKNCTYLPINIVKLNSILSDDNISHNTKQKDCIRKGLKELEEANLIKIISNNKNDYELDLYGIVEEYSEQADLIDIISNISHRAHEHQLDLGCAIEEYSNENSYAIYEDDVLKQLLKDCGNKKTILKYLSNCVYMCINKDGSDRIYFVSDKESLAKSCGINILSVDEYNNILMKNKIIYIRKFSNTSNAYGLYKNKNLIDGYINMFENMERL